MAGFNERRVVVLSTLLAATMIIGGCGQGQGPGGDELSADAAGTATTVASTTSSTSTTTSLPPTLAPDVELSTADQARVLVARAEQLAAERGGQGRRVSDEARQDYIRDLDEVLNMILAGVVADDAVSDELIELGPDGHVQRVGLACPVKDFNDLCMSTPEDVLSWTERCLDATGTPIQHLVEQPDTWMVGILCTIEVTDDVLTDIADVYKAALADRGYSTTDLANAVTQSAVTRAALYGELNVENWDRAMYLATSSFYGKLSRTRCAYQGKPGIFSAVPENVGSSIDFMVGASPPEGAFGVGTAVQGKLVIVAICDIIP